MKNPEIKVNSRYASIADNKLTDSDAGVIFQPYVNMNLNELANDIFRKKRIEKLNLIDGDDHE